MSRTITITLILIIAASSILCIGSATAQSLPVPSTPKFSLRYVDHSYNVPATYCVDPYTGQNVVTHEAYHIQNRSVEIVIENQAFTPYINGNGSRTYLYYNIALKGHFEKWGPDNWPSESISFIIYDPAITGYIVSSESSSSVVAYGVAGNNGTEAENSRLAHVGVNGQVDFKVQAIIGYTTREEGFVGIPPFGLDSGREVPHYYIFTGKSSGWSETQTITIGSGAVTVSELTPTQSPAAPSVTPSASLTQNPTVTPIQPSTQTGILPEITWKDVALAIACIVIVCLAAALVLSWRKKP